MEKISGPGWRDESDQNKGHFDFGAKIIMMLRNSLFLRVAIISLLIIAVSRVCIYFMRERNFFTNFGEFLYSCCYVLTYISIFSFLISCIILLFNLVRKRKA